MTLPNTSSHKGQYANSMAQPKSDFFADYLAYAGVGESEAPAVYHRWTCASLIGSLLGRQIYFPLGHQRIYPNQFILLMGTPASRKGTAMGIGKMLAQAAGYTRFGSDKTSKERFLMDMKQFEITEAIDDLELMNFEEPSETYIVAGEFVDFIGINNIEFANLLTNLWDNLAVYKNPKIVGKSVEVTKPTVNLLGGATAQTFALAIPPESNGTGFLSRLLLIHGEPTGIQVAWPAGSDAVMMEILAARLREMREEIKGEMHMSPEARTLGARMYRERVQIDDGRFQHYDGRRFIHLNKLAMIMAAIDMEMTIQPVHLLKANTMLASAEIKMPQALGGFGKDPNSDVKNKILDYLNRQTMPKDANAIFRVVQFDLKKMSDMLEIMQNLKATEKVKVITVKGKQGYVSHHEQAKKWPADLLIPDWLTDEEKGSLI